MGTPAKQIGWSTEANLLHSILKQLDLLSGVIATSGGGGGITGTGTANFVSKWSSPTTLVDSIIQDNGFGVNINGTFDVKVFGGIDNHFFQVSDGFDGVYVSSANANTFDPSTMFFRASLFDFNIGPNPDNRVTIGSLGGLVAYTLNTIGFTVGTLPAGTQGMRTFVTDASAPAFGSAVVGGGAVVIPVFHNGTTWIVG